MEKRERLYRTAAGEMTDRPPVALWRYFPGDDQRAADFARSVVEFQIRFDWDFVLVAPAPTSTLIDYGLQDEWAGAMEGTRHILKHPILRSLDWTALRALDPMRGALGRQYEAVRLIAEGVGESVPIIVTVLSPLAQAQALTPKTLWLEHLRTQPERLRTGLNILTETTLRWMEALHKLPIDGIFYRVQPCGYGVIAEDEYRAFALPYDRKLIEAVAPHWGLNILRLDDEAPIFRIASELAFPYTSWRDRESEPDLAQGRLQVNGALWGGLAAHEHLYRSAPTAIRDAVREALDRMQYRRLIVGMGSSVPLTAPLSHLHAVRASVEP